MILARVEGSCPSRGGQKWNFEQLCDPVKIATAFGFLLQTRAPPPSHFAFVWCSGGSRNNAAQAWGSGVNAFVRIGSCGQRPVMMMCGVAF
jgi:hypothetical protein